MGNDPCRSLENVQTLLLHSCAEISIVLSSSLVHGIPLQLLLKFQATSVPFLEERP